MGLLRRRAAHADTDAGSLVEAEVVAMAPMRRAARQPGRRDVEYAFTLRVAGVLIDHTCRVPHDKTPLLGQRLPVRLVAATDPYAGLDVAWAHAPSLTARALASAEAAQRGDHAGAAAALGFTLRDR
jgi:hypothetical protein